MDKILAQGNEAVGWGALMAGCEAFFGYPITPQNEVIEWFAREFPKRGKVFLQTHSETSSINMLFGAAACGVRAMTSTASQGYSLMLEGISHMVNAELPGVIVLIQRGGPGMGTTQHSQMDYYSAKGGGHGGYKNIVLAPASVQEVFDLVQLAFYLADKYRNPVIVTMDAIIAQMRENLVLRKLDFGPLPPKEWAIRGKDKHKDGRRRLILTTTGHAGGAHPTYLDLLDTLSKKFKEMEKEVRYEELYLDDAEVVVVAFGYCARVSMDAIEVARRKGIKVGLLRPITLWPFPKERVKRKRGSLFIVVEDNLGLMFEDVKEIVGDEATVRLVSSLDRHLKTASGMIFPEKVLEKIEEAV